MNREGGRYHLHVAGVEDLAGRLKRLRETPDGRAKLELVLREQAHVVERLARESARRRRTLSWPKASS